MSFRSKYRARVNRTLDEAENNTVIRTKLDTSQHILHLILTIITGGLWIPVWIVRACQGNKVYVES